jgi:hypothetical protein
VPNSIPKISRQLTRRALRESAFNQINERDLVPVYKQGVKVGVTGPSRKARRMEAQAVAKGWWRNGQY